MELSYYAFAFFVFLLVCASIWFLSKVMRGTKKEEKADYTKEQRLYKLYQNVEDMMTSFEEYVEETKAELDQKSADISEMLKKMDNITSGIDTEQTQKKRVVNKRASRKRTSVAGTKPKISTEQLIAQLISEGMDKSEIAKKLGMSSREISLIMEIKKIKEPTK